MAANHDANITPALSQWLAEQRAAGFGVEQILQAMLQAGWSEAVTRRVLGLAAVDTSVPAVSVPVPWPEGAGQRLRLQAGDRQVLATVRVDSPPLLVLQDLLSADECRALIEAARPRMARSLTVDVKTGGEELHQDRTSDGMFFARGESELISRIESRVAQLLGWPVENGEGLQVLRYGPGAEYKPHYDYFDPAEPGTPAILQRGGQRVATLVMYLNEPEAGGATVFPDIGLQVVPQQGSAVFFSYAQAHPDSRTLHGGEPVLAGEKWIATKWLREREFN
jgi:prolyl 4-hydroxylase